MFLLSKLTHVVVSVIIKELIILVQVFGGTIGCHWNMDTSLPDGTISFIALLGRIP